MPRAAKQEKTEDRLWVAIDDGVSFVDGEMMPYKRGVTRVREGHPLLSANPGAFKRLEAHYDVETATAGPGEARAR